MDAIRREIPEPFVDRTQTPPDEAVTADDDVQPRAALRLIVDRNFGPYIVAQQVNALGTWVVSIAAAVIIFDITKSVTLVGLMSVIQFGSVIVLAPLTGALADRFDRRLIAICCAAIIALAMTWLAVVSLRAGDDGLQSAAPIFVAVLIKGVALAFASPATKSLIPGLVPAPDLPTAVMLEQATLTIGRAVGPVLGSTLLIWRGAAASFTFAAACGTVFLVGLVAARVVGPARTRTRGSLLSGFRYVWQERRIRRLLAAVFVLGYSADPALTLTPALAAEHGGGPGLVGSMVTAFGIGSVAAVLVVGPVRRVWGLERLTEVGLGLSVLALIGLAAGGSTLLAIGSFVVLGLGFLAVNTGTATQIQMYVTESMRGRVMAIWGMAFFGSRPVAAAANGAIADNVSVTAAFVATAVVTAVGLAMLRAAREPVT